MEGINMSEFCGGVMQEQFDSAFARVVENCMNPMTELKGAREITIRIRFVVDERRQEVAVGVQTHTKLAPEAPGKVIMGIGRDLRTGEVYAEEYCKSIPGQRRFTEDGEIIDEQAPRHIIPAVQVE